MREKLYRMMIGRNGPDQLSRFASGAALALVILNLFFRNRILWIAGLILLVYADFRMFSRDIPRRRAENAKYLALRGRLTGEVRNLQDRWRQRKDYAFFRCPDCKAMLRVPRGKGKIRVTCRKCGNAFERKT